MVNWIPGSGIINRFRAVHEISFKAPACDFQNVDHIGFNILVRQIVTVGHNEAVKSELLLLKQITEAVLIKAVCFPEKPFGPVSLNRFGNFLLWSREPDQATLIRVWINSVSKLKGIGVQNG